MKKTCLCMALAALFVVLAGSLAAAKTYYVDPQKGSKDGDGSSANPWATLKEVISEGKIGNPVKGGDTLLLLSGDHGRATISAKNNAKLITIMAQEGHRPVVERMKFSSCKNWMFKGITLNSKKASSTDRASLINISGGDGTKCNVTVESCTLYTVPDASSWTKADWNNIPLNGIGVGAVGTIVRGNYIKNINFGISGSGDSSLVEYNTVKNFAGDGLRGLGDDMVFQYNTVMNCYDVNDNHDDGFQSWSRGSDNKVGTGTVYRMTLRGNTIIDYTDPNQPFRGSLQGIGCFDGMFEGWVVENNLIMVNHWHGISLYGAKNCKVHNNTVCDLDTIKPGPPWIKITAHKNKTPASGCIVRNNLTTKLSIDANSGTTQDHNIIISNPDDFFVDYDGRDMRLKDGCAAIDSGMADGAPAMDIRKAARPYGSAPDVGAYEWGGLVTQPARRIARPLHSSDVSITRISAGNDVLFRWKNNGHCISDARILSLQGKIVSKLNIVEGSAWWNADHTSAGAYIVTYKADNIPRSNRFYIGR